MDFVNAELAKEHGRWISMLSEESNNFRSCTICINDVLDAHFSIVDYFFDERDGEKAVGGIGPRDAGLLSSAVARQNTSFGNECKWKTDYEKCATLFYGLIKNHAFHDCNKRTATLSALFYLLKLKRTLTVKQKKIEELTIKVAENNLESLRSFKPFRKQLDGEINFLAQYFQKNTRPINKRFYIITYHQLNAKLKSFDFRLDNPHGNFIDVIKVEQKRKLLGIGQPYIKETKVGTIGFPGWTKEVPRKEIKAVRTFTGLTPRDGFDSEVFYRGAEPLKSLINEYSGLLKRLANK